MHLAFARKHSIICFNKLGEVSCFYGLKRQSTSMCDFIEIPVQPLKLLKLAKSTIIPRLSERKHKGQYGRIGVIGGSLEYTGAPYFAAISALKAGADLAHVFCQRDAAVVIKSYSPELIVHPLLDVDDALEQIQPWLEKLHIVIIGPGLGREQKIQNTTVSLMEMCQKLNKPMIIDADGLAILNENIDIIGGYRNVILTPNAIEFQRIFSDESDVIRDRMSRLGTGVIVLEKGPFDKIHIASTREVYKLPRGGSGRRCGGQGDVLCGTLATFFNWSLQSNQSNPAFLAAFSASFLVKQCNAMAFRRHGRSMLASDMINEIHHVFQITFEHEDNGI